MKKRDVFNASMMTLMLLSASQPLISASAQGFSSMTPKAPPSSNGFSQSWPTAAPAPTQTESNTDASGTLPGRSDSSGRTYQGVNWTLANGVLTIMVSANVSDDAILPESDGTSPWSKYASLVTKIVFQQPENKHQFRMDGNCSYFFSGYPNLASIEGLQYLNTETCTSMRGMFRDDTSLKRLDIINFDMSKVGSNYTYIFDGNSFEYLRLPAGFPVEDLNESLISDLNENKVLVVGQEELNTHDSTIYPGDTWDAANNFDSGKDQYGKPITLDDCHVFGTVDTSKIGTYKIRYWLNAIVKIVTVTVAANQKELNTRDSTVYVGDTWNKALNFVSGKAKDGTAITLADVTVDGSVDTTQPGTHVVHYKYDGLDKTATVTVLANQRELNTRDSTVYVGDTWNKALNFVSGKAKDGTAITLADVTVDGSVDTTQPGTHTVHYKYDGLDKTATVTVLANQKELITKDSTIRVGDTWDPSANFVSGKDKAGNAVTFKDTTVEGSVDTTMAGKYEVHYKYDGLDRIVTVMVAAKPLITSSLVEGFRTVSGTSSPGATIKFWVYDQNGNTPFLNGTTTADEYGNWTLTPIDNFGPSHFVRVESNDYGFGDKTAILKN